MSKIRSIEVEAADSVEFVVPVDCTAVRAVSNVAVTITSRINAGGAVVATSSAATSALLSETCFGRHITITGTGVSSLDVLIELD